MIFVGLLTICIKKAKIKKKGSDNMTEKKYSQVLLRLRKEKGLTQADLAAQLNIAQRTYSHYEKGTNEPSIETLIKLADIYGVPVDVIIGRYEIAK